MPASSSAIRATLRLSSPAWLAQPKNTSSTCGPVGLEIAYRHQRFDRDRRQIVGAHLGERTAETADGGPRTTSQMNTSRIKNLSLNAVF